MMIYEQDWTTKIENDEDPEEDEDEGGNDW